MHAEQLNKTWLDRQGSIPVDALMRFSDEGLVLGAGTVLVACGASERDISVDPSEPRLRALLTVAHLGRPTKSAVAHLRKAADCRREGQDALAAMHLVLSRLDRLAEPEADAHRLFLADGLMRGGVDAHAVVAAIESLALGFGRLQKYDPDQPRVAAGSGRTSGQWTSDGASSAGNTPTTSVGVPRAGLGRTRQPRPSPAHPPSPGGPVNPQSITPVAGGHKANSDAGRIALKDCLNNVVQDALTEFHDQDWAYHWIAECTKTEQKYYIAEYQVEMNEKVIGGFVRFPDGGLIIMRKGRDDVYVPRGYPRPRFR
jgi:hypothetical protein